MSPGRKDARLAGREITRTSRRQTERQPSFLAVTDPDDPDATTYWRRENGRNSVSPWPGRIHYGPVMPEPPKHITDAVARHRLVIKWAEATCWPWHRKVSDAIAADPYDCAARFVIDTSRCCVCGRKGGPELEATGICAKCLSRATPALITRTTEAMARRRAA